MNNYKMKSFYFTLLFFILTLPSWAQDNPLYRYVNGATGAYGNDGLSWAHPKKEVQDAINDLHDYMDQQGLTEGGYVFVAKGTYHPTESTNPESPSQLYLAFKIYAGINVWGGWNGDEVLDPDMTSEEVFEAVPKITLHGQNGNILLNKYETKFDGNLTSDTAKFTWNENKQRWITVFPSNVHHVVTFATNGFDENGRAHSLTSAASLNAITILGGRAYNTDPNETHPYNAYGGGVYMVNGAVIRHSRISHCEASRSGGGIYMDGGGRADHNIITQCQAMGLGVQHGYGGGIFVDQAGEVEQCYMIGNAAREGGGLGMVYDKQTADAMNNARRMSRAVELRTKDIHQYSAICKASLIGNNTTSNEAGGVYMNGGGVLDGVTIVRNRCNGSGAVINGLVSGQSSGVFANGPARIYNSVIWGNQNGENTLHGAVNPSDLSKGFYTYDINFKYYPSDSYDDIQFASTYTQSKGDSDKPLVSYVAMNNSDLVNWSSASSHSIISLATPNDSNIVNLNYAKFSFPAIRAGVVDGSLLRFFVSHSLTAVQKAYILQDVPAGIKETLLNDLSDGMLYVALFSYKPNSMSALAGTGLQLSDLPDEDGVDLSDAWLEQDILDADYSPLCDLGCYIAAKQVTNHSYSVQNQDHQAGVETMTLFVDPNRSSSITTNANIGSSWDRPFKHLRDALKYIWDYRETTLPSIQGKIQAYKDSLAAYEANPETVPAPVLKYVNPDRYQILVKEGTVYTAATATNERISISSIYMLDNVAIYGGYPAELTGEELSTNVNGVTITRNPVTYPTVISGAYTEGDYGENVGHLVNFLNINNAILDGFQLRYGNASGLFEREGVGAPVSFDGGGGIVISNAYCFNGTGLEKAALSAQQDMTGIKIRNCIIADCTARTGAAVFTHLTKETTSISAEFENCIFHNNSAIYGDDQTLADNKSGTGGIINVYPHVNISLNHCNIMHNVGYGAVIMKGATLNSNNSMFYANLDRPTDNVNGFSGIKPGKTGYAKYCTPVIKMDGGSFAGQYNMFDSLFVNGCTETKHRFNTATLSSITSDVTNKAILTYNLLDNSDYTFPAFKNATKNAGISTTGDITYYGNETDWTPTSMNPVVNNADPNEYNTVDITTICSRDFGGAADIGAVENGTDQLIGSFGLYVRAYNDNETSENGIERDGTSWTRAINGNAEYLGKTLATVTVQSFVSEGATGSQGGNKYKIRAVEKSGSAWYNQSNWWLNTNLYAVNRENNGAGFAFEIAGDPILYSGRYYRRYYIHVFASNQSNSAYVGYVYEKGDVTQASADLFGVCTDGTKEKAVFIIVGDNKTNFDIIPYNSIDSKYNGKQLAWNWHGGGYANTSQAVGLYSYDDSGSAFYISSGTTPNTTSYTLENVSVSVSAKGLQYAINKAAQNKGIKNREVWLGAGTYYGGIELKDGVDILGGFPNAGSPSKQERDISNAHDNYKTIIDAQDNAIALKADRADGKRAVYQDAAFTSPTMLEGLIITHGKLVSSDPKSKSKNGAGMYLQGNSIVKNCLIEDNENSTSAGGAGIYMVSDVTVKNSSIKGNTLNGSSENDIKNGGAGVYMYGSGNKLINSLIVENKLYGSTALLGAACITLEENNFYNCTVAYNLADTRANQTGNTRRGAAAGGFWDQSGASKFYNCIFWGNAAIGTTGENYVQIGIPGWSDTSNPNGGINPYLYSCYHSAWASDVANSTWDEAASTCKIGTDEAKGNNKKGGTVTEYADFIQGCHEKTPFVETGVSGTGINITFTTAYKLKPVSQTSNSQYCVNLGEETVGGTNILTGNSIYEDIMGEDRVQDCRVDKGAYEYNAALNIAEPTILNAEGNTASAEEKTAGNAYAYYYVSYGGAGTKSATSAGTAACWTKLQRVLDAAGRLKYAHPNYHVIVKLAGQNGQSVTDGEFSDRVVNDTRNIPGNDFRYKPSRTMDPQDEENERMWSILVPHGVEVWGGYAEDFSNEGTKSSHEFDMTEHQTYLDGYYKSQSKTQFVNAYHVVEFTDKLYDTDGKPYLSDDITAGNLNSSSSFVKGMNNPTYLSAGDKVSSPSVLNGVTISNGHANGTEAGVQATRNLKSYGGGAIVPSYASIRNCIVEDNLAYSGGGGLYLQPGATVCGVIVKGNSARYGGGVYFEEPETDLSKNYVPFEASLTGGLHGTVMTLAQLVSSTVTNNEASIKGGGIYYKNNGRVVGSVIWGNECGDQANVSGQMSAYSFAPSSEITFAKYPFCYSAVENNRLPGANNISVASANEHGTRFLKAGQAVGGAYANTSIETPETIDPFYRLTDFSQLLKVGTSKGSFYLAVLYSGAPQKDMFGITRIMEGYDYIDMGAAAFQQAAPTFDMSSIMPRLYVAQSSDVNMSAQQALIGYNYEGDANKAKKLIYKTKGSSFAYPFQTLDEALEYIRNLRKSTTAVGEKTVADYARNIPFEIIMGKGFFYPTHDIYNVQGESYGNTFVVPEGVTIVGGFDVKELGATTFYGQSHNVLGYNESGNSYDVTSENLIADRNNPITPDVNMAKNLKSRIKSVDAETQEVTYHDTTLTVNGMTIKQLDLKTMKARRDHTDNNVNDLDEPWEFKYQTILSGMVINSDEADNVLHVVTVVADENIVGKRPTPLPMYAPQGDTPEEKAADYAKKLGTKPFEMGASVELNGIEVTDGQAYEWTQTCANGYIWKDYYHGGGVMVDGNWYSENGTPVYKANRSQAVAYRDIPLVLDRCNFSNNMAGYGGAISANGHITAFSTTFESNQALSYYDLKVRYSTDGNKIADDKSNLGYELNESYLPFDTISYPGNGGAIYGTYILNLSNCVFQNNEATLDNAKFGYRPRTFNSVRHQSKFEGDAGKSKLHQYGGCGGAIYMGGYSTMNISNCNFVRNKAYVFPCLFTRNPNYFRLGSDHSPVNLAYDPVTDSDINHILNLSEARDGSAAFPTSYNRIYSSVFWGNEATNTEFPFTANQVTAFCPIMSDAQRQGAAGLTSEAAALGLMTEVVLQTANESVQTEYGWSSTGTTAQKMAACQKYFDTHYAQSLWFCAYEEHTGLTPRRYYDIRMADFDINQWPEAKILLYVLKRFYNGDKSTFISAYQQRKNQDYNQTLSSDNDDIEGPNFTKPSNIAGIAGYQQDADWMPKRMNKLTDGGWGYIEQVTKDSDNDGVVFKKTDSYYTGGGAYFEAYSHAPHPEEQMPIGDAMFMRFVVTGDVVATNIMRRISKMPTPTVPTFNDQSSYAYIDIGAYEYQHQRLGRPTKDVDYLWVSPREKSENGPGDGTSWNTPTTDVQRAIETLLCNRNGHHKVLYMIEGTYKPIYPLTNATGSSQVTNTGFTINTENLNSVALTPERLNVRDYQNIPSFTILGGFSAEVPTSISETWRDNSHEIDSINALNTSLSNAGQPTVSVPDSVKNYELMSYSPTGNNRDPEMYPTVFYGDDEQTKVLFDIADARQWNGAGNPELSPNNDVIPITIDGVNFYNRNAFSGEVGAALHYENRTYTNGGNQVSVNAPANAKKLTITRCKFYGNGNHSATVPAVTIGGNGGESLIYNSLFHSNNGTAIKASKATLINNTIAKNKVGVNLDDKSKMHASVLWGNTTQYEGGLNQGENMTFNAIQSLESATNNNISLSETNSNIVDGPNFVDPNNADTTARDFHLQPSMKLLNGLKRAEDGTDKSELYYNTIKGSGYSSLSDAEKATFWNSEKDLSFKSRKIGNYLDLGAYEYQNALKNYVYYNPNHTQTSSDDGASWEKAYGYGKLQDAIDMVAVAARSNASVGYVFAKGGRKGISTNESITIRSGVNIIGSIPSGYLVQAGTEVVNEKDVVTNKKLKEYAKALKQERPGMAGPSTERTLVTGISSPNPFAPDSCIYIDGLEVCGSVNIIPSTGNKITFRNSIVWSDAATAETSTVGGTLVYNTLFRGNAKLSLSTGAFALNVTSQLPFEYPMDNNNKYCRTSIAPTSILGTMDKNIEFQLMENNIADYNNAIEVPSLAAAFNTNANHPDYRAVDYLTDRDLLGNPRKLDTAVDNGAFELWKVSASDVVANYSTTNNVHRNFPHEGSFVYVASKKSLVLDPTIKTVGKFAVMPGWVLLHEGASIYGQGNKFMTNRITIEKTIHKEGEIVAMPFDIDYSTGVSTEAILTNSNKQPSTVHTFDGVARADRDYSYENGWTLHTSGTIPACQGVRYVPTVANHTPLFFNAVSKTILTYAYMEDGASKDVVLTQYNIAGETTQEDMGWNCIGSPYLIGTFNTRTNHTISVPAVWKVNEIYYPQYEKTVDGVTTYYYKVVKDGVTTFKNKSDNTDASVTESSLTRSSMDKTVHALDIAHRLHEYHYPVDASGAYTAGDGRWWEVPSWKKYDTGTETEPTILMGEGLFTQTATLRSTETLTFYAPKYIAPSSAPGSRAAILRHTFLSEDEEIDDEMGDEIQIFVLHSELHVTGLQGGERIAVCSTDGRLETVHVVEEDTHEFVTPISSGIHVVRVDNESVVIMNHDK